MGKKHIVVNTFWEGDLSKTIRIICVEANAFRFSSSLEHTTTGNAHRRMHHDSTRKTTIANNDCP